MNLRTFQVDHTPFTVVYLVQLMNLRHASLVSIGFHAFDGTFVRPEMQS